MYDKRVARGSTYAAMVIPAGTNPDAMMMEKKQEERKKKSTLKVFIFSYIFREGNRALCLKKYILTGTYLHLNQYLEGHILMCKQKNTLSS